MEITKVIYGIDISSESFTVSHGVLYQNTESKVSYTRTFNNNENGFKSFIKFTVSLEKKYISGNQTRPHSCKAEQKKFCLPFSHAQGGDQILQLVSDYLAK